MTDDTIALVALAAVVVATIAALTAIVLRRQRIMREAVAQREAVLRRLTERFGDTAEFIAFAESADAGRLFETVDGPTSVAKRLLSLVAASVVVGAVGVAFLINSLAPLPSQDINYIREAEFARWWAIMFIAVGIGLGVAAALCIRAARRWGILPE